MSAMASQIASLTIVYSTVYSVADQRKHQSSASLAFVRWIHQWIPHTKGPVTRKMIPFDDVIMKRLWHHHPKPYNNKCVIFMLNFWSAQFLIVYIPPNAVICAKYDQRASNPCPIQYKDVLPASIDRKSPCGDKAVVISSYFHKVNSYTGKRASLYWISCLLFS